MRTSNLPLGSLEVHAWCPSLPQCKALRYQSLSCFPIHGRKLAVERLHFHLPGQHAVFYQDHDDIDDVLSKPSIFDSKFISWMNTNKSFPEARNLTYALIYTSDGNVCLKFR